MDEATLLDQARQGDESAFVELYRRYYPDVYRVCLYFSNLDADEAKDILQESFVRAFRNLNKLKEGEKFRSWLLTIARNRCLTYLGKEDNLGKKHRAYSREQLVWQQNPVETLQLEQQLAIVRSLIEEMPEGPLKECGKLFYIEGVSTPEIAQRLNITKSTVPPRLDRFRNRIRKRLLARLLDE